MQRTAQIMGMPITVRIAGDGPDAQAAAAAVMAHFTAVDNRYSTYKPNSEITRINAGLPRSRWSAEMKHVLDLCEQTKQQTMGYFDIEHNGVRDPSGLVKGWAIQRAAELLLGRGIAGFYVDAGGDIQTHGRSEHGAPWRIGIRSPFNRGHIIKAVRVSGEAVATSGSYIRGRHIYNPVQAHDPPHDVVSLTVIGPAIYDADRFATAAFAMGRAGIAFINGLNGFEGYMIDSNATATFTPGFERFVVA